jgi:tetratricopeptide (TPR) repeat protein
MLKEKYFLACKDYEKILNNENTDKETKNKSLFQYAEALYNNEDDDLALKAYKKCSLLDSITEEDRQFALMRIANIYLYMRDFDNALKRCMELLELKKLYIEKSEIYSSIALIHTKQNEIDKAIQFVKKGLEVITIGSAYREQLLYQYATISFSKGEYHKALSISEKLLKEDIKNNLIKAGIYMLIIIVSYTIQDIQKARRYLKEWKNYINNKNNKFLEYSRIEDLLITIFAFNQEILNSEMSYILKIMSELHELEYLSKALIGLINYFIKNLKDITQFRKWQLLWEEIGEGYEYLQPALKALKATRLAVEEKTDKPLFALPKEIRDLVLPMLEDAIKE